MKLFVPLAAVVVLAACSPAQPPSYSVAGAAVDQPFSRPAAAGGNGAGFFTVTNRNTGPDRLMAVESPIAGKVEIHETSTDGGIMRMERLDRGVDLKPGESVTFKPGGKHVMFSGLHQALKAGDRIPATLVFEKAGRAPVEFVVQGKAAAGGGMDHNGH